MRPTPRTQPYRAGAPRMPGMVLQAMLQGRVPGQVNGGDFERQRRQAAAQPLRQVQQLAQLQMRHPGGLFDGGEAQRTADRWPGGQMPLSQIPMRPGAGHPQALHDLILAALQMQRQRARGNGGIAAPPVAHI